jgi:hypothetical protein
MALNTIYNGIDLKVFKQIKDLEKASEVWVRLGKTYEGTIVTALGRRQVACNRTCPIAENPFRELTGHDLVLRGPTSGLLEESVRSLLW